MKRVAPFTLCMLLICSAYFYSTVRQDRGEPSFLDRLVADSEMKDVTIEEAVTHLLVSNHVVGGIAVSSTCKSHEGTAGEKHVFTLNGRSMRQALDEILNSDHNYHWVEENHTVVVSPVNGIPELLQTEVEHFEIDDSRYTLSAASGQLLQLPEIKRRRAQLKLKGGVHYFTGSVDPQELLKSKLTVSKVRMYEALNVIAQTHGAAVWRYAEYHCAKSNEMSISWIVR